MFGCNRHYDRRDNGHPTFTDGWPLYINTTKVERQVVDAEGETLGELICPEALPRCSGGTPPSCVNDRPERVVNTYAIANGINAKCDGTQTPSEDIALAVCRKYGFKQVISAKAWHGRNGFFAEPLVAPPSIKYCRARREYHAESTAEYDYNFDNIADDTITTEFDLVRQYTVAPGSGVTTLDECVGDAADDHTGTVGSLWGLDHTGQSVDDGWTLDGQPYLDGNGDLTMTFEGLLNSDQWSSYETTLSLAPGTIEDYVAEFWSVSKSVSDSGFTVTIGYSNDTVEWMPEVPPEGDPYQVRGVSSSWTLTCVLSVGFTKEDLDRAGDDLLSYWNFDDDVEYPWRTDSTPWVCPLVTHDEATPRSPDWPGLTTCDWEDTATNTGEILGKPLHLSRFATGIANRGGNEAFWDSARENITDTGGGCYQVTSYGAYAPAILPNATQWTEDTAFRRFVYPGAFAAYNYPGYLDDDCVTSGLYREGYIVKSKWAETFVWYYPAHNYARPCGEDANTIDPDTINCDDDGTGNPVNPGQLRWPDAPATCSPARVRKQGDFCLKTFSYDFRSTNGLGLTLGALTNVQCDQMQINFSPCRPSVIYIQREAPARKGAIHILPPSVSPDDNFGSFALKQISQRMVDPLWKRPRFGCDTANPGELDESAEPPMEECRTCADGACNDYVERVNTLGEDRDSRCEPVGLDPFWEPLIPEVEL